MVTPPLDILRFLVPALALIVPGVVGWTLLFPQKPASERWTLGAAGGLAASVYLAFALSYIRLSLFWPAWAVLTAATLALWLRQRPRAPLVGMPRSAHVWLGIILLLVAVSRFWVALGHYLPPGWDPSFHLLLAKKLLVTGRMIDNWEPFEQIPLNYPLGSHLLVVNLARLSGLPLHTVFNLLIPFLGVVSTALIYALSLELSKSERVAVQAALAYGLWAVYGSIDYYRWGGLPNCLGMLFVVALLTLLAAEEWSRKHTALLSLFFVAVFFTHHHVMLAAGATLAALFAYYLLFERRAGRHIAIALGLTGSALLGCFYIVPYALKARSIHDTGVLVFWEEFYNLHMILARVGVVLAVLAAAGFVWYLCRRERWRAAPVLLVTSGTLLALFVLFEYAYRYRIAHLYGHDVAAFTPSRFLTDLVYFLSIFAGYAMAQLGRTLRAPMGAVVLVGIGLAFTNKSVWLEMRHPDLDPRLWQAYRWVDENTPPDTIVLTGEPWAPYGCWRRTLLTPIPISEPQSAQTQKFHMARALEAGRLPAEARPCKLVRIDHRVHPGARERVVGGRYPWLVIEVWPGEAAANSQNRTGDR